MNRSCPRLLLAALRGGAGKTTLTLGLLAAWRDLGLYDGLDALDTSSTADLAKALATPVVLVVDCTMRTRTTAALVLGCQHFDPLTPIRGVILNQIARPRHDALLRRA